jgi:catechol 2,3-dioxygenase-like lactoylglutathione lyase family enzyme
MPLSRIFAAFLIVALAAVAQSPSQGSRNIAAGHIHLNSADPGAAIAFWKDIIGTLPSSYESLSGVSTLGVTIFFTRKTPSGPSAGSAIDHLAFKVPDLQPLIDRLAKTPYKSFHPQGTEGTLMIDSPDGVRIELIEDSSMYAPLEFSHIHFHSAQPKEMQAWYLKNFGGRAGTDENLNSILIPGATLTFTQADSAAPTAERAIDYVAFEVKDLGDFCKQLIGNGVKLDSPPHAIPEMKASIAILTDPWGARIELMEKAPR